jgi:hypothetical protein
MIGDLECLISPHFSNPITSFLPVKSDKAILGFSGIIPNFDARQTQELDTGNTAKQPL